MNEDLAGAFVKFHDVRLVTSDSRWNSSDKPDIALRFGCNSHSNPPFERVPVPTALRCIKPRPKIHALADIVDDGCVNVLGLLLEVDTAGDPDPSKDVVATLTIAIAEGYKVLVNLYGDAGR